MVVAHTTIQWYEIIGLIGAFVAIVGAPLVILALRWDVIQTYARYATLRLWNDWVRNSIGTWKHSALMVRFVIWIIGRDDNTVDLSRAMGQQFRASVGAHTNIHTMLDWDENEFGHLVSSDSIRALNRARREHHKQTWVFKRYTHKNTRCDGCSKLLRKTFLFYCEHRKMAPDSIPFAGAYSCGLVPSGRHFCLGCHVEMNNGQQDYVEAYTLAEAVSAYNDDARTILWHLRHQWERFHQTRSKRKREHILKAVSDVLVQMEDFHRAQQRNEVNN